MFMWEFIFVLIAYELFVLWKGPVHGCDCGINRAAEADLSECSLFLVNAADRMLEHKDVMSSFQLTMIRTYHHVPLHAYDWI